MARTLSYSGDGEGDGQQCGTVIVHVDMPDTGLHRLHQAHLCRAVLLQRTSTIIIIIIIIIILWLQRQFTLLPWYCGKKPHFLFAEPWKGVGKGMLSPGCLL